MGSKTSENNLIAHRVRNRPVVSGSPCLFVTGSASYAAVVLLACIVPIASAIDVFPGTLPGVEIQQNLPSGFEPSGAIWHPRLERLFVVSDSGIVTSMDGNGENLTTWYVPGDLESIAIADPDSDLIYLGIEGPPTVLEFNFVTGQILRSFDLSPWIVGLPNELMEALTFVNDPSGLNPEGGLFYAGHQGTGGVYEFLLPIRSSTTSTQVTFLSLFYPMVGWGDLADLYYQPETGILWAIWDYENVLRALTSDGLILGEWDVPGNDQEGFTVVGCTAFVGEDSGKVMRYDFWGLGLDSDHDAVLDCADACPDTPPNVEVDPEGCSDGQIRIIVRGSDLRLKK